MTFSKGVFYHKNQTNERLDFFLKKKFGVIDLAFNLENPADSEPLSWSGSIQLLFLGLIQLTSFYFV